MELSLYVTILMFSIFSKVVCTAQRHTMIPFNSKKQYHTCHVFHPGRSCPQYLATFFMSEMKTAAKVYGRRPAECVPTFVSVS